MSCPYHPTVKVTGISPEDLPHIFDRFYHADESGSSGLDLAIARALVTAHGGTLGVGTTMQIHLPRRGDEQPFISEETLAFEKEKE